jgi:hypothetical protein
METTTATAHFTARVSGKDTPLGYFATAEEAMQYAEEVLACNSLIAMWGGNPKSTGYPDLTGTLQFVFLTAGAG